jgi:hypothetical protein
MTLRVPVTFVYFLLCLLVFKLNRFFSMLFELFLMLSFFSQVKTRWNSFSTSVLELQSLQIRCSRGMFSYRPRSIWSLWSLNSKWETTKKRNDLVRGLHSLDYTILPTGQCTELLCPSTRKFRKPRFAGTTIIRIATQFHYSFPLFISQSIQFSLMYCEY